MSEKKQNPNLEKYLLAEVVRQFMDFRGRTPLKLGMEWGGGDIRALSANNVQMGRIDFNKEAYFGSTALYKRWMTKGECEKGDILLTTEAPLGNVAQITDNQKYILSQRVILLKVDKTKAASEYLFHLFRDELFQKELIKQSTGSTVTGIQQSKLVKIKIELPSLLKQQKIAKILNTIDRAITHTEALIEKYQQIKAGLMHDLFTRGIGADGQLRPTREQAPELYWESPIGWIPKEWEVLQISELAAPFKGSTVIGPFGSDLVMTDYRSEGTPIIFVRDVKEDQFKWVSGVFISSQKTHKLFAHRVNGGDLLATKMGLPPCVACVYPEDIPMGVITADIVRMTVDSGKVNSTWLSASINYDRVKRQVAAITAGVTRPKVTLADFRNLKIATPSIEEQLAINSILDRKKHLILSEEDALLKLQKQKSGLMHDLLTGKVQVTLAEAT
jgi:type I restriction enzyme, S subunit